jgi:hypothetical protein
MSAGANDGDGASGRGVKAKCSKSTPPLGDRVSEERDHGVRGQDVAKELGADVLVDRFGGERRPIRCEVVRTQRSDRRPASQGSLLLAGCSKWSCGRYRHGRNRRRRRRR